ADENDDEQGIDELGSLLRAADLIGQLGDPHYLRKTNALYYEFEEIGLNKQLGYESPADIVDKYRNFIGTTSLRTSRPLSVTSMLPRVGVGGLQASTATYFVPSVSYAIRGHSRDAADVCDRHKADRPSRLLCVRFRGQSGHRPAIGGQSRIMSTCPNEKPHQAMRTPIASSHGSGREFRA